MTYFREIFTPFAILLTQILESLKNYLTLAYSLVTTNSRRKQTNYRLETLIPLMLKQLNN